MKAGKSFTMEEGGTPEISLIDEEVLAPCWLLAEVKSIFFRHVDPNRLPMLHRETYKDAGSTK